MLATITFCYTGISTSIMGWINTYLIDYLRFSAWWAAALLSTYSVGLALGRLFCGFIAEKMPYQSLLALVSLFSVITSGVAFLSNNQVLVYIGFALTGFAFASLLPLTLSVGTSRFPTLAGTITGITMTFGAVGRTIIPGLVGVTADYAGVHQGFRLLFIFVVVILIATITLAIVLKKSPKMVK